MHQTDDQPEHLLLDAFTGPARLDQVAQIREASRHLAEQARRELLLFGQTLEPPIYDQAPFLKAVRRLALARPVLSVRILLLDPRSAAQRGHRLIELSRQLTSRIAIRRVSEDDRERLDAFLIADERGFIHRRIADSMEALADFDNPSEARRMRAELEQLWEHGEPDPEMRRLHL